MISGVLMILTTIWLYQTLMKSKTSNFLLWLVGASVIFLAVVFVGYYFCNEMTVLLEGKTIGEEYDPSMIEVHDRKTQKGPGGLILPFICELLPGFGGFIAVALVRTQFILKQALTPANLFSGVKEMFISIKDSFKTHSN